MRLLDRSLNKGVGVRVGWVWGVEYNNVLIAISGNFSDFYLSVDYYFAAFNFRHFQLKLKLVFVVSS